MSEYITFLKRRVDMTTDLGVYWRISHSFLFLFFEFLFQEQWIDGLLPFHIRSQKAKVNIESLKNNFKPHEKTQATEYTRCQVSDPKPEEHGMTFEAWKGWGESLLTMLPHLEKFYIKIWWRCKCSWRYLWTKTIHFNEGGQQTTHQRQNIYRKIRGIIYETKRNNKFYVKNR